MLKAKQFGLAGGIIWGLGMFVMTIIAMFANYGRAFLGMMSDFYIGYTISGMGAFVGLVYGFIDGFIGLFLLAWVYNKLIKSKK
jgi:hypothetical protein